ncbi:hypothetical protein B566_EDAN015198 [Ephemera danica]|nr:hypothetical protein B566_EDAN015198 [Ephemera danica]
MQEVVVYMGGLADNEILNETDGWWNDAEEVLAPGLPLASLGNELLSFVPPPPRPSLFMLEELGSEAFTATCDLCTLLLPVLPTAALGGELGWVLTLTAVALLSAVIGAAVMVTVMHCRKYGVEKPFTELINANLGDGHAFGQMPITFIREVLALIVYPPLLEDSSLQSPRRRLVKKIRERKSVDSAQGPVKCVDFDQVSALLLNNTWSDSVEYPLRSWLHLEFVGFCTDP